MGLRPHFYAGKTRYMNDYLFNVGLHFVTVYLSTAIGIGLARWVARKVWKLASEHRRKEVEGVVQYHRVDQGIKKVTGLLITAVLAWGLYSSLTHGPITYKHNDVDAPIRAVQEMKDYRATMARGAQAEITLEGALQPEASESRAERIKERLDWKSRREQEKAAQPEE